ncbi:MAG TPA: beta-N-acetylhexosaminidase [Clostridia bacterium]|nr:beta-N-acetylhexosaminidase [Clostridia bacterium]
MKKSGVLLLTILFILIFSGCSSQNGENGISGTIPGQSVTTVAGNGTGSGTAEDGTGVKAGGQAEGQTPQDDTGLPDNGQTPGTDQQTGKTGQNEQTGQSDQTGKTGQGSESGQGGQTGSDGTIGDMAAKTLNSMSLDEKIGQMFIVGFDGTEPGTDVKEMIKNRHTGGVILFQRNVGDPVQLLGLNNSLKEMNKSNKAPLFISVDEEGGRVSRMPDQLVDMPAALTIGNTQNINYAYDTGALLADEIASFGFNTDFAPVLDIWSNPQNTVIGDRAFGTTPETVKSMGISVFKGIRDRGIIPVVKHFPGHGDTVTDSHIGLPKVDYGMKRLKTFELVPFQAAIDKGADAVMVAHILMTALDKNYPASLSKAVITDLLRTDMGFDGVVITDDMTMGAIAKNYDIGKAAVRTILAGSDIVLVCHGTENQKLAMDSVKAAVKNGTIPMKRINESVGRILRLKYKYRLSDKNIKSVNVDELNKKIAALLTE